MLSEPRPVLCAMLLHLCLHVSCAELCFVSLCFCDVCFCVSVFCVFGISVSCVCEFEVGV